MTAPLDFESFPKIPRLNRDVIITEKIDGTDAAVVVRAIETDQVDDFQDALDIVEFRDCFYALGAQSRNRLLTLDADNAGFARWVEAYALELVEALGVGRHFGEWWGSGIQRGYGLTGGDKRFSLFNVDRHKAADFSAFAGQVNVVPTLYRGPNQQEEIENALHLLETFGSVASPEFMDPEGIVIFHTQARTMAKVTIKDDAKPKALVAA